MHFPSRFPKIGAFLCFFWALLGIARPASAQVHFTTPVPTLEQALAAAKEEGKPLLLEFSTTWCGPCKSLARAMKLPQAQPALELVHLVVYDGDAEPGGALMQKYGASGFPTLLALDKNGEEASRQSGYGDWSDMETWIRSLPELAVPVEDLQKLADADPKNIKLQLSAARRLFGKELYEDARPFYARVQKSGSKEQAAAATWALVQLDAQVQQARAMSAPLEKLAAQYPGTKEAERALRFLATLPSPQVALMETLLAKHIEQIKDANLKELPAIATVAMKARAFKAATQVAARLAPAAERPGGSQAQYLATLGEVAFYVEGNTAKALALGERVLALLDAADQALYRPNLERYRRDKREPGGAVKELRAPSLALPRPERRSASSYSPAYRLQRPLSNGLRDSCWQHAGAIGSSTQVMVLSGARPKEHRLVFSVGTTPAFAACATALVQATEIPAGEILQLEPSLTPLSFEEQLDDARSAVRTGCKEQAGLLRSLPVVLRGEAGKPVALHFPSDGVRPPLTPALRSCIERTYAEIKAPRAYLDSVRLSFLQTD